MTEQEVVVEDARPSTEFLLPGRWWHIVLGDPADTARQIRAMARSAVGRQDDRAQLRRDIRVTVERAALVAEDAEATDFYFALEIVPGVPIPACLAVYWPDIPYGLSLAAGPRAAADSLASSLRTAQPATRVVSLGDDDIALVRSVRTMVGPAFAATGVEGAQELVTSYWVIRQDAPRPLLLSFTTALVSLRDEMVDLFDAIVSTLEWVEPAAT